MREELKYPIVFALQKMTKEAYENYNSFDEVIGYIVSPCYLVEEHLTYYEDGTSKKTYDVVFPRSVDGIYYDTIDNDFIPKYNVFNGYTNTTTVDYITFDYEKNSPCIGSRRHDRRGIRRRVSGEQLFGPSGRNGQRRNNRRPHRSQK